MPRPQFLLAALLAPLTLAAQPDAPPTTPMGFTLHTIASAPEGSKSTLLGFETGFGFVPNLVAGLAESPAALEAYVAIATAFEKSAFSTLEKQIVMIAASRAHDCSYCAPAHASVSINMLGLDPAAIRVAAESRPIDDPRLEALRVFTTRVAAARGDVTRAELDAFLAAGFSRANALDVVAGVAAKAISNYTNRLIDTPLDPQLR